MPSDLKSEKSLLPRELSFFQPWVGAISFVFMCASVCFWALLVHLLAPLLLIKKASCEVFVEHCFDRIYLGWVTTNEWWFQHVLGIQWDLDETMKEDFQSWSLLIANHRSWVDVFVILAQLKGRRPLPRVFIKQSLFWLPLVGSAAYLMGFPFMKRYSKAKIAKNPNLAGKDLATTLRSCRRLIKRPSSMLSFAEGTRFSVVKQTQQASPYACLLRPKAGGIVFLLQAMPQKFYSITDINILYCQQKVSAWDVLCGRLTTVKVMVREVALPDNMLVPEYQVAGKDREDFFTWFNLYWQDKDIRMMNQLASLNRIDIHLSDKTIEGKTSQK